MINLIKETGENLQPEKYETCYKLVKDNQSLGFGTINKEQRGNGYGKILFSKMLEETKKMGYDKVKITFSRKNEPMLKIATDNGGQQTSFDEDSVKYVFPLK